MKLDEFVTILTLANSIQRDKYEVIIKHNCNLDDWDLEVTDIDIDDTDKIIIVNTRCRA